MPPKKFGLIKMQGFAKGVGVKKTAKPKPKPNLLARPSVFGNADDDEEDSRTTTGGIDVGSVNASLVLQGKKTEKAMAAATAEATAEDPNAFAYDELYDDIHQERDEKAKAKKATFDPSAGRERKESRYIASLKSAAEIRKIDDERVFQMKLKKEADEDADEYGDKEKFVTSAYKEKLIEMKRWKEEDKRLQNLENETTVEGKKDMTGFYANLMTKNLAMGQGNATKDATSAYTIGSKRNQHIRDLEEKQRKEQEEKEAAEDSKYGKGQEGGGDGGGEDEEVDYDELLRKTDESDRKRRRVEEEGEGEGSRGGADRGTAAADSSAGGGGGVSSQPPAAFFDAAPSDMPPPPAPAPAAPAGPSQEELDRAKAAEVLRKKEEREAKIKAAKERMLARKQGKP